MATVFKGHVCPPSNAKHPSDRWESAFIFSFISKFTNLQAKLEGLETPMDLENALLLREPDSIVTGVLIRFILNLRPQTRNISEDQISTTVAAVMADYFRTSEQTIFWDDKLGKNVDPFSTLEGGFFAADWDFKLKILRQLVELQLSHSAEIKGKIDLAWGVNANRSKKKDPATAPPEPSDPNSQANLQMLPFGQDRSRKRYWLVDKSPRIYISTNPWKTTATFQSISSTREEYVAAIENLKQDAPHPVAKTKKGKAKNLEKHEASHLALIEALEGRLEIIDTELLRVARVRKKIEQRKILMEQAELRQTRTRRQTRKPDYAEGREDSEDEGDDYIYQEDEGYEEDYDEDGSSTRSSKRANAAAAATNGQRRSTRSAVVNANGKREAEDDRWKSWRGERRSTRLGAPAGTQMDYHPPPKRARTEDSSLSTNSSEAGSFRSDNIQLKITGAAALKPNEFLAEHMPGTKKKSKFWVYAVEPISGAAPAEDEKTPKAIGEMDLDLPTSGNHGTDVDSGVDIPTSPSRRFQSELDRSMAGSLSPLSP